MNRFESDLEKEEAEAENVFGKTLRLIAYPVSAISGYVFSKQSIRNSTYDNLRHTGAFEDIRQPHYSKLKNLTNRFLKGEKVDVVGETVTLHEEFKNKLTVRMNEMNLGTLDKQWKFIHTTQKHNALLTGFTAAGISIGSLLTMANSKIFNRTISNHLAAQQQERTT